MDLVQEWMNREARDEDPVEDRCGMSSPMSTGTQGSAVREPSLVNADSGPQITGHALVKDVEGSGRFNFLLHHKPLVIQCCHLVTTMVSSQRARR